MIQISQVNLTNNLMIVKLLQENKPFYCDAVRQCYVVFTEKLMRLRNNCLNSYHPLGKDLFYICYGSFSRICNIHQT